MNKTMRSLTANRFSWAMRSLIPLSVVVAAFALLLPCNLYSQDKSVVKEIVADAVHVGDKDSAAVSGREKSLQRTVVKDSDGNVVATSYGSILPTTPYSPASQERLEAASQSLKEAQGKAFTIPSSPVPPRLVNDFTGILSPSEVESLERRCVEFANSTSNQITIVILPTFGNYDKADLAFRIGREWGVGQSKYNNGVVMLVKPKIGTEKGEAFIAVGTGLEPVLTDATANRIFSLRMVPAFKENDYYNGINDALNLIFPIVAGEISDDSFAPSNDAESAGIAGLVFFLMLFFIILILAKKKNGGNNYGGGSRRGDDFTSGYIFGNILGSMMGGSSGRGGFGGGGFGGGGFGGFGGGGFSGGGAGGSW